MLIPIIFFRWQFVIITAIKNVYKSTIHLGNKGNGYHFDNRFCVYSSMYVALSLLGD